MQNPKKLDGILRSLFLALLFILVLFIFLFHFFPEYFYALVKQLLFYYHQSLLETSALYYTVQHIRPINGLTKGTFNTSIRHSMQSTGTYDELMAYQGPFPDDLNTKLVTAAWNPTHFSEALKQTFLSVVDLIDFFIDWSLIENLRFWLWKYTRNCSSGWFTFYAIKILGTQFLYLFRDSKEQSHEYKPNIILARAYYIEGPTEQPSKDGSVKDYALLRHEFRGYIFISTREVDLCFDGKLYDTKARKTGASKQTRGDKEIYIKKSDGFMTPIFVKHDEKMILGHSLKSENLTEEAEKSLDKEIDQANDEIRKVLDKIKGDFCGNMMRVTVTIDEHQETDTILEHLNEAELSDPSLSFIQKHLDVLESKKNWIY